MEDTLPWFRTMPATRQQAVSELAATGIRAFLNYYASTGGDSKVLADIFGAAPRELLRSISLQQTLQLTEVVVTVVEERVASKSESLQLAILRFSRDVAFVAADLYAKAAEARGLWDARLEALVVDSIVTGESPGDLSSRISALGWKGTGPVAVLLGSAAIDTDADLIRRTARKYDIDVMIALQGRRVVVVFGLTDQATSKKHDIDRVFFELARDIEGFFGPAPLVLGPTVSQVPQGYRSARACIAAAAVVPAFHGAPHLVHADQLLPERAFAGDPLARQALIENIYEPIVEASGDLLETLLAYFESGRSLEATSRKLYVHTNTVRYRIRKIHDLVHWNPAEPRDAFVLQSALAVGAIPTRSGIPSDTKPRKL